jgi:TonB-dependent starch-binding outer membrane protein SusC
MRKSRLIILMGLLFCVQILWAQTPITGRVTDRNGNPLPNATITVKNTNVSTVSDLNGEFSINAAPNATLIISTVGYQTLEIVASGSNVIAQLTPGENTLSEVIVTGYGTKIKRDLTGNIARVRGSEVANIPVPNLNQALQGRAAGVFVESNNGKVGEGVKVRIRGLVQLSASNEPLYVIDGVPINTSSLSGNALADINFNDIETFDILKDAAAATIYGSRAANGVVLITTKKGRSGRTDLTVNMQYGYNKPTGYRGFLNSQEYVDLIREAAINSDIIEGVDPLDPTQYAGSWLQFTEGRLTRYSGHSDWRTLETNTNWEKLAFNDDARTKMVDITASGGNDKTRFSS